MNDLPGRHDMDTSGIHRPNPYEREEPMGWNDHHPGIDPDDPDPGETLRGMADMQRQRSKDDTYICPTCGENPAPWGYRCARCIRNIEEDRMNREQGL